MSLRSGGFLEANVFANVYANGDTFSIKIGGFDWDDGNWPKCAAHGLSREEVEEVILGEPAVLPDPYPSEPRQRAIGRTSAGRYVFLVFTLRTSGEVTKVRPISARYMHQKEIDHYENKT